MIYYTDGSCIGNGKSINVGGFGIDGIFGSPLPFPLLGCWGVLFCLFSLIVSFVENCYRINPNPESVPI